MSADEPKCEVLRPALDNPRPTLGDRLAAADAYLGDLLNTSATFRIAVVTLLGPVVLALGVILALRDAWSPRLLRRR